MIKTCESCKLEFKTYKTKQKYCSRICGQSNKKLERINKQCEYTGCTNIFETTITAKRKFCSISCQINWQKYYQLGENNGNFGRENKWGFHNADMRLLISKKITESWETPERLVKHLAFLDRHRTEDGSFDFQNDEFRNKISIANIKRISENGVIGSNNFKRGYYDNKKTNVKEYYHSSFEEKRMNELDLDDEVIFWTKKHGHVIKYIEDNKVKRYLPDFLIINKDGTKIMEEVKGYIININNFKLKCEASLLYFNSLNIRYKINFMGYDNKNKEVINWFNNLTV
jgi:hypothetical protein